MKVSFQNISKQYKGKYVLKDFTTELTEGVYGLLGANGAGKTTLINIKEIIILKEGTLITQGTTDVLEQSIYGKVWEVTANVEDAAAYMTASTATGNNPNTMTGNIYSDRNILEKYYVQPMEYEKSQNYVYNSSADYDCMGYEITQDAGTFDYYLKNASAGETLNLVRSTQRIYE